MALPSFVIPPGEKGIDRRRRLAEVLAEQGSSTAPVQSWTQGAARVAQSLASVLGNYQANQMEGQRTSALQQALSSGATAEQLMGSGDPQLMQLGQFKALREQRQAEADHQVAQDAFLQSQAKQHQTNWQQSFDQSAAQAAATAARADRAAARQPPVTRQVTQADGSQVMEQYDPDSGSWNPAKITGGSAAPANPDAAIPVPKLTEGEQKSFRFYRRARNANNALSPAEEDALRSGPQTAIDQIPMGNAAHSNAYQSAKTHADRIIASLNYSDSGASMGQDEYHRQWRSLIPQYGDGPDNVAAKRQARADALSSLRATTGKGVTVLDKEEQAYAEAAKAAAAGVPHDQIIKRLKDNGYDDPGIF